MYEDDPQDKVFDVLGEAVFGDHPLGRAVIGRAEVIARAHASSSSRAFHAERYVPGERRDRRRRLGRPRRARRAGARSARARGAPTAPRRRAAPAPGDAARARALPSARTPSSTTSASAAPGIARDDERRFALRVLDSDPRRHLVLAAVPGGARAARPGLLGLLVLEPVRATPARSASTSARAPTTSPRRCAVIAAELERVREEPATRRGARARARRTSRAASCSSLESTARA